MVTLEVKIVLPLRHHNTVCLVAKCDRYKTSATTIAVTVGIQLDHLMVLVIVAMERQGYHVTLLHLPQMVLRTTLPRHPLRITVKVTTKAMTLHQCH
jgi:hypothetical protein